MRGRRPAHVLFHQLHAGGRFDVEAAGVEHNALAYQRDLRRVAPAPGQIDEPGRLHRRHADSVDERKVARQKFVADNRDDFRARRIGETLRLRRERRGRQQVCGRVDEVSTCIDSGRDALDWLRALVVIDNKLRTRPRFALEARVAVKPKAKPQRGEFGPLWRIREAISPCGKRGRKSAGGERFERIVVLLAFAEQDAGQRAGRVGKIFHIIECKDNKNAFLVPYHLKLNIFIKSQYYSDIWCDTRQPLTIYYILLF